MSKYHNIGVVTPVIKMEAVFYEKGKLTRDPVIALLIVECSDEDNDKSTMVEPLCWNEKFGIIPAMELGSYLGLEAEYKERDWTEDIKRIDEFEEKKEIKED